MTLPLEIRSLQLIALAALASFACASASTTAIQPDDAMVDTAQPQAPAASLSLDPVYFDSDRAVLLPEARDELKSRAKAILDHPQWGKVTIEGHCDERGSDEYNMALGQRRAASVAQYLMDLGVPSTRMATVTFGESRPAVAGHDESAWRLNRRSELASEAIRSAKR